MPTSTSTLAEEAPEIIEALGESSGKPGKPFSHIPSLTSVRTSPSRSGTRPFWDERYPMFLEGREIEEEHEPLGPRDEDVVGVEYWEGWEQTILWRP